MVLDIECCHIGIGNRLASRIIARIEDRLHDQASRGLRAANESQHGVPGSQRHAGPVAANLAEEAMLDRVPLRESRWVMAHGDGQAEAIAELDLQSFLPGSSLAAIAAASVS
jgi:hypothetical protein